MFFVSIKFKNKTYDISLQNEKALAYDINEGTSKYCTCCAPWTSTCATIDGMSFPGVIYSVVVIKCPQ